MSTKAQRAWATEKILKDQLEKKETLKAEIAHWKERAEKAEARNGIVWLIEQPETESMPIRWWHPKTGWMRDANKACWFVRKEDAEALLNGDRLGLNGIVTEHKFCARAPSRKAVSDE